MSNRHCAFVDLQGTLGGEGDGNILGFSFYPESLSAIRLLNRSGLPVIILTGQSDISKGLFSLETFERRVAQLRGQVTEAGGRILDVYCCPHRTEDHCQCLKPKPGLVLQAARDHDLTVPGSYLVGDSGRWDMLLARRVGCKAILVRTGLGSFSLGPGRREWEKVSPDFVAADIQEAARWIAADFAQT